MIPPIVSEWHRVTLELVMVKRRLAEAEARFVRLLDLQHYDEEAALRESPRMEMGES